MVKLVEKLGKVSRGTALGVGGLWITMFVVGLIMILIPLKKREEGETSREDAEKIVIPGAVIFGLSLLFATPIAIAFFVLLAIWLLTFLKGRLSR